ncbi:MAG: hypothetical protein EOP67_17335 [Sphingomonas sp.]|nr:MAG: hypothetical protein EOP67_17335 [Sphingomonas sp.]
MVSDDELVGQALIDRAVDALATRRSVQIWLKDMDQPFKPTEISSYSGVTSLQDERGAELVVRTASVARLNLGPRTE